MLNKRARMCKEEADLWAAAYLERLLNNPLNFDPDYSIISSYPDEVLNSIKEMNICVYRILSTIILNRKTNISNS